MPEGIQKYFDSDSGNKPETNERAMFDIKSDADAWQYYRFGASLVKEFQKRHGIKEEIPAGTYCFLLGATVKFFGGKEAVKGKSVVDIGGGTGSFQDIYGPRFSAVLADLGANVHLVDTIGPSEKDFSEKYKVSIVRKSILECEPDKDLPGSTDLIVSSSVIGADTFSADVLDFLRKNAQFSRSQVHYINKNDVSDFEKNPTLARGLDSATLVQNNFQVRHNGFDQEHRDVQRDGFLILENAI